MATVKTKSAESILARVLVDTRIGNSLIYAGDLVQAPANLLAPLKDQVDINDEAVAYAKSIDAKLTTVEADNG